MLQNEAKACSELYTDLQLSLAVFLRCAFAASRVLALFQRFKEPLYEAARRLV